ncbi:hypothetical protein CJD35_02675 [Sphingobium xenophagum]|uniref:Uncharacterized protein n=1 Tax=Sphingobium xenophagum TaxID=121428 RepID=A0A249MQ54_SPHXE|nr:hypothetical protein CJD35_02675 [Sphingobium xenophagum]
MISGSGGRIGSNTLNICCSPNEPLPREGADQKRADRRIFFCKRQLTTSGEISQQCGLEQTHVNVSHVADRLGVIVK